MPDPTIPGPVLDAARRLYRAHGRPLVVRVPSIADGLEARIARAGFAASGPVSTLLARLDTGTPDADVSLSSEPSEGRLAAKLHLAPKVGADPAAYCGTIAAILLPTAFAALWRGCRIVAVAYAAVHENLLVLESVVTDPSALRRGHRRRIVRALKARGHTAGADAACLQVESDNSAAFALYRARFETNLHDYRCYRAP